MSTTEQKAAELAIGRIFRLMSRPTQPGDVEQYEAARQAFLSAVGGSYTPQPYEVNYARDRLRGSAGD